MAKASVHATAIVGPEVELADDVIIGPFSIIKGHVKIGSGTRVDSHAVIGSDYGRVEMGKNNWILPGACVGGAPQDLSYKNEPTQLIVGDGNTIREAVTINIGTTKGGGVTRIGNRCLLMAYTHLGHDCHFGDQVVVANSCQFAGHVVAEDFTRIGGMCAISQHVRLGKFSYIGGYSAINKDIIPFSIAQGRYALSRATNKIGLQRAGFSADDIAGINTAMRFLTKGERTLQEAIERIETEIPRSTAIEHLLNFVKTSESGLAR
jgi:UDP-N-acetylglucosamine acyltransferase